MAPESRLRSLGVTGLEGLEQPQVVGVQAGQKGLQPQGQGAHLVLDDLQGFLQVGVSAGPIKQGVELIVEAGVGHEVQLLNRLGLQLQVARHGRDGGVVHAPGGQPGGQAFQHLAHLVEVQGVLVEVQGVRQGQLDHVDPAVGLVAQQTLLLQPHDRLRNRGATDPQLAGELLHVDARAGLETVLGHHLLDGLVGQITQSFLFRYRHSSILANEGPIAGGLPVSQILSLAG